MVEGAADPASLLIVAVELSLEHTQFFLTKGEKKRLVLLVCACAKNYQNSDNSGYFPGILMLVNII